MPTLYEDWHGTALLTSQYAVTEFTKTPEREQLSAHVPGIFLRYDIEPILVRVREQAVSFGSFLVRLCGIVGGVWVVAGMVYRGVSVVIDRRAAIVKEGYRRLSKSVAAVSASVHGRNSKEF